MVLIDSFKTFVVNIAVCLIAGQAVADAAPSAVAVASPSASISQQPHHENHGPDVRHEAMMLLTVDKKSLSADLRTWPEDPTQALQLKSFRIAIGKNEGDKQHEGDNKTPEGIYFAQSHIDGAALPEKYGARAIPIDFPNPMDRISHKTGHGIWLHGVDREQRIEEAKVTEGCVAFYNSDIDRLSAWLKSHQGIVVIARDASEVNRKQDLDGVRMATMGWMSAWANRDVKNYIKYYSPDFHYQNYDLARYHEYKERVFASYRVMEVKYDNLRIITHPKYAISFFNQDFQGDKHFSSIGRKILYWERSATGEWLIKREVFENRRFEHVTYTDGELALLSSSSSGMPLENKEKKGNL